MEPYLNALALYVHIGAGIVWIGVLLYIRFLLLPSVGAIPPEARGPIIIELGPRGVRFAMRAAEITLIAGVVMMFIIGRATRMEHFLTTLWGQAILAGFVGSVAIYVVGRLITAPVTRLIVDTLRQMAAGTAREDAPAYLQALTDQQKRALNLQLVLAAIVVFTMALARFS